MLIVVVLPAPAPKTHTHTHTRNDKRHVMLACACTVSGSSAVVCEVGGAVQQNIRVRARIVHHYILATNRHTQTCIYSHVHVYTTHNLNTGTCTHTHGCYRYAPAARISVPRTWSGPHRPLPLNTVWSVEFLTQATHSHTPASCMCTKTHTRKHTQFTQAHTKFTSKHTHEEMHL